MEPSAPARAARGRGTGASRQETELTGRASGGFYGRLVGRTFGDLRQAGIGGLFLGEGLLQELGRLLLADQFGPAAHGAVAGDLVVLDRLGGGDQAGVDGLRAGKFLEHFLAFLDDALDGRTGLAACRLADQFEHLLQALDLHLGLLTMFLEGGPQLGRLGATRHFRQCLQDLALGVIDVLEHVLKKIVKRFGLHGFTSALWRKVARFNRGRDELFPARRQADRRRAHGRPAGTIAALGDFITSALRTGTTRPQLHRQRAATL
ncbi:hypothetical protein KL86PLE_40871 [uncultured Pleomorphomonas sp.]|uniref:Uncharacterized protein n=1 Tax=uncultured Pleomorphomonas sp. TaxID=442121 RepID=A0A212LHN0_9HYPH|nr:hypothetical protein KL86PLE_40871 [uncultured Pleomorphomonas sp.]